jgi:ParB family chromosome partitioning protein
MAKSAKRLGRGLDSLVSNLRTGSQAIDTQAINPAPPVEKPEPVIPAATPVVLSTDKLLPNPFQPRGTINTQDVLSLAESIRRNGILQPISVRPFGGRYQIIAGERRWQAARHIGLAEVPVIVRDSTDEEMLELALIENIEREDLNAIDRALAYREFCDQFKLKPEQVASRLGEDRTTVINYLRLLDLSKSIQSMVATSKISMGHARCLLGIADEARRMQVAESAVENQLSVRALEEVVRREKTRTEPDVPTVDSVTGVSRSAHLENLEERFEQSLGTKVTIREGKRKSTGRIVIQYFSLDDFDRVAERLGVASE